MGVARRIAAAMGAKARLPELMMRSSRLMAVIAA